MASPSSPGRTLRTQWNRLNRLPGGKYLFSKLVGRMAPYTGTIDGRVEELEPGYARVVMRNHLNSVHAVALMNLAEETSGMAMMASMPDDARSILTGLSIEYLKKARGTLVGECRCPPLESSERREYEIVATIRDAEGDEVARAVARWLVGPRE